MTAAPPAELSRRDTVALLQLVALPLRAGAKLGDALAAAALPPSPLADAVAAVATRLKAGKPVEEALRPEIDPTVAALLAVGRRSGATIDALETATRLVSIGAAGPVDETIPSRGVDLSPHRRAVAALAIQIDAGIPIIHALTVVGGVAEDEDAPAWAVVRREVESGASLGAAMAATGHFPSDLTGAVTGGEMTGQLSSALRTYLQLGWAL